jgi:hypothetical protein
MGFGLEQVSSDSSVRHRAGCPMCSDFSNLVDVIEKFDLPQQEFPADLKQKDESLTAWRDRLYLTCRIPTRLAALSDLKFSYVEQINPLLSRSILNRVKEMPDRLRTDKILFIKIVNAITPKIPFANKRADALSKDILRKGPVVELLYETLQCDYSHKLFSSGFLSHIIKGITVDDSSRNKTSTSYKKSIKKLIPSFIKNLLKDSGVYTLSVNANILAFRVYIIVRMHQILREDSTKIIR